MPKRSDIAITKTKVDALLPGQQIWDSQIVGFGIVANRNSKSYKLKYYFNGRQRMLTIGLHGSPFTVQAAREKAMAALVQLKSGIDPADEKKLVGQTVSDLCDEYLLKHANVNKKESSAHEDATNIKNHVKPLLGAKLLKDITAIDIEHFKFDVQQGKTAPKDPRLVQLAQKGGKPVTGGKGVANRCLSLLSKMFNLAELWGYRTQNSNPVRGISKFKENQKERFLTEAELKRVWAYMDKIENDGLGIGNEDGAETGGMQSAHPMYAITCFRLLILSGARVGEIQTLRWDMVDLPGKRLNLPDSKTGKKVIQLSEAAVGALERLPRVKDNPYVIVGRKAGTYLKNLRKPWKAICNGAGLNDVRIHDLRHSFASFAAAQGQPLLVIGKLLGHKNPATTQRYVHLTDHYLSEANQVISDNIGLLVRKNDN